MTHPYRTNALVKPTRLVLGWISWCYPEYRRWRRKNKEVEKVNTSMNPIYDFDSLNKKLQEQTKQFEIVEKKYRELSKKLSDPMNAVSWKKDQEKLYQETFNRLQNFNSKK